MGLNCLGKCKFKTFHIQKLVQFSADPDTYYLLTIIRSFILMKMKCHKSVQYIIYIVMVLLYVYSNLITQFSTINEIIQKLFVLKTHIEKKI